jgi:hypothetical protein
MFVRQSSCPKGFREALNQHTTASRSARFIRADFPQGYKFPATGGPNIVTPRGNVALSREALSILR